MAKLVSAEETRKNWGRIELRKGLPAMYQDKLIFFNPIYITETTTGDMAKAQKDPRVKKAKDDPMVVGKQLLIMCMAGIVEEAYTEEVIEGYIQDSEMEEINELSNPAYPNNEEVVRFSNSDLDSDKLLLCDFKRLQEAFAALNYLGQEEVTDFFTYPIN